MNVCLHLINDNRNNKSTTAKQTTTRPATTTTFTLNWSHFKPDFSGKPDDNAEVHLLCSNDWMNAHHFVDGVKVQRFWLALLGEARLWYHSLEPINVDWPKLQNLLRQRYLQVGNMTEQLFHA